MEFLVEIDVALPPELDAAERARLAERELARGTELCRSGAIRRIWRVPGRLANVGLWAAEDASELHDLLVSLPMWPYMQVTVRPLARHPLESDRS